MNRGWPLAQRTTWIGIIYQGISGVSSTLFSKAVDFYFWCFHFVYCVPLLRCSLLLDLAVYDHLLSVFLGVALLPYL
jgi:hypothetical protein